MSAAMGAKTVLAFDIGASGGRGILGELDGGVMRYSEVYRFANEPVLAAGTLYWDILRILHEVKQGIRAAVACARGGRIDSIAIDTWGVDFGLLSRDGKLAENPIHYRDARGEAAAEEIDRRMKREQLYGATGIQFMFSNTLNQIVGQQLRTPGFPGGAETLLMIPDLLVYFLTGDIACELTVASTTQLYDPSAKTWNRAVTACFGIPDRILPRIVMPGAFRGCLRKDLCEELRIAPIPVYTAAEHDTASAVAAVPFGACDADGGTDGGTDGGAAACISCGTASVIGAECDAPYLSGKAFRYNFTNEIGYGGTVRLMKNIMGMWLIQESRRQWEKEGKAYTFQELSDMAARTEPFQSVFDPDDARFIAPGDIPGRIVDFCRETGQAVPASIGATVRCIYESLALKHALRLGMLADITGRSYTTVHIVGGGSKDSLFCEMLASACGCRIVAGPHEAAAIGNCAVQLLATGAVDSLRTARRMIASSVETRTYAPSDSGKWRAFSEAKRALLTENQSI